MSTGNRPILILILICATILSVGIVKVEKSKNNLTEVILDDAADVTSEDISEIVESEIIEETKNEPETSEITENLQGQSSQEQSTENKESWLSRVETSTDHNDCNVPSNNTIKSYMDYRYITSKNSRQYKLQHSLAYTGDYGIRMVRDRYCIALGSYYTTTIGQHVDVELENGHIIKGILADCKADEHTDSTNRINPNGSVVEFVVDTKVLNATAKRMGDMSYVNNWNSRVVNIKVYDFVETF